MPYLSDSVQYGLTKELNRVRVGHSWANFEDLIFLNKNN